MAESNSFLASSWQEKFQLVGKTWKMLTGIAWRYTSRWTGIVVTGILMNVAFFILLHNEIDFLLGQSFSGKVMSIGISIFFFIIAPIAYGWVANRYALQSVLYFVGRHLKISIFEYFFSKALEYAQKNPVIKAQLENNKIDDFIQVLLPEYMSNLSGMNRTLQKILRKLMQHIDLVAIFQEAKEQLGNELTPQRLQTFIAQKAATQIPAKLTAAPNIWWLLGLILFNSGVFFFFWWIAR